MNNKGVKSVIVVDKNLPLGMIANTVSILGMSLGKQNPELVGCDTPDKDGNIHLGITEIPIPVLMTDSEKIQELRIKLFEKTYEKLKVIDFSSLAQSCMIYEDYIKKMNDTKLSEIEYWGVAIYGNAKSVNTLTGSIPLLR